MSEFQEFKAFERLDGSKGHQPLIARSSVNRFLNRFNCGPPGARRRANRI